MNVPQDLRTAFQFHGEHTGWKWNIRVNTHHGKGAAHRIRLEMTPSDALMLATLITMSTPDRQGDPDWPVPILPALAGEDEWLTTAEVAARLGVKPGTITSWINRGCPKASPFPEPGRRVHYRNYWQASVVDRWASDRKSGRGPRASKAPAVEIEDGTAVRSGRDGGRPIISRSART